MRELLRKIRVACLVYRATALQGREELEKVIDMAERILLLLDPASLPALFLLAENCLHVRSYARAEQVLEEALRLHPETAHFHALLAQVRERMGKPAETFLHLRAYRDARRETRSRGRRGGIRRWPRKSGRRGNPPTPGRRNCCAERQGMTEENSLTTFFLLRTY